MAISEESRHHLYQRLEAVLGPQEATTLMEHLPPVGWADVATKQDLATLRIATNAAIEGLRAEVGGLRGEVGGLRAEVGGLRGEVGGLRGEVDGLRGEVVGLRADLGVMGGEVVGLRADLGVMGGEVVGLRADLGVMRQDIESALHAELNRLLLWLLPTLLTALGLVFAVAFAAAKLS